MEQLQSETKGVPVSDELRFRIATNLALCALILNEIDTARQMFQAALVYQPDSPKALANGALAALLGKQFQQALDLSAKARRISPRDSHATAMHLEALYRLGHQAEIDRLIAEETWIEEDPECTFSLGKIAFEGGNFSRAESWLRASLRTGLEEFQTYELLAVAIIRPVQQALRDDPPLVEQFVGDAAGRLAEGEQLLTKSAACLDGCESRELFHGVLANRANVRGMLDRVEDAIKDCDRVLLEDETHDTALHTKGLLLLQSRRSSEAITCFERLSGQAERASVVVPLARAYLNSGQPQRVIELLKPRWELDALNPTRDIDLAGLLAQAYTDTGRPADAESILHTLIPTTPRDPEGLCLLSHLRYLQGRSKESIELLQEALTNAASVNQRNRILLQLANIHGAVGEWARAAEIYEAIVDSSHDILCCVDT